MIFYKYQALNKDNWNEQRPIEENLAGCYTIQNLFNRHIAFTGRNAFNDLFDSRVELITPKKDEYREVMQVLKKQKMYLPLIERLKGGKYHVFFDGLRRDIENIFDSYRFYCVSTNNTSNLMWSHYADSHNGFCVGWNEEYFPAAPSKVNYRKRLATYTILDSFREQAGLMSSGELGMLLWNALLTKFDEWDYEEEYRIKLPDRCPVIKTLADHKIIELAPGAMERIVFGYRCPPAVRKYIQQNNPNTGVIYQAVVIKDNRLCTQNI